MRDVTERAFKAFIEGVARVVVPALIAFTANGISLDLQSWITWFWPVAGGAVSAGISAAWNTYLNWKEGE